MQKPLVFISYDGDEHELADFVKSVLSRIAFDKIDVFVAKRDIPSGDNPLKTMLEEKLKIADAIIPICSKSSKNSSWLWWETASVWAKSGSLHPLFTNISANAFGQPLTLVAQGKDFFIKDDFIETLITVCEKLNVIPDESSLSEDENQKYNILKGKYSKYVELANVTVSYEVLTKSEELHRYSLIFEVENKTESVFEDVILELYFPNNLLYKKVWTHDWLIKLTPTEFPEYARLTFTFNSLPERTKNIFSQDLLPAKTLRIFGKDGVENLVYFMNLENHIKCRDFKIWWNLYINKQMPQTGSMPFYRILEQF